VIVGLSSRVGGYTNVFLRRIFFVNFVVSDQIIYSKRRVNVITTIFGPVRRIGNYERVRFPRPFFCPLLRHLLYVFHLIVHQVNRRYIAVYDWLECFKIGQRHLKLKNRRVCRPHLRGKRITFEHLVWSYRRLRVQYMANITEVPTWFGRKNLKKKIGRISYAHYLFRPFWRKIEWKTTDVIEFCERPTSENDFFDQKFLPEMNLKVFICDSETKF